MLREMTMYFTLEKFFFSKATFGQSDICSIGQSEKKEQR